MNYQIRPALVVPTASPAADIQKTSVMAARLIESAMALCGADDLPALDCLMNARRALSPLVDTAKTPPANANCKTAAPDEAAVMPVRALQSLRR